MLTVGRDMGWLSGKIFLSTTVSTIVDISEQKTNSVGTTLQFIKPHLICDWSGRT